MKKIDNTTFKIVMGGGLVMLVILFTIIFSQNRTSMMSFSSSLPGIMMRNGDFATSSGEITSSGFGGGMMADEFALKTGSSASATSLIPPMMGGQTAAEAEPRIIKTADLSIGVDGVAAKTAEIATLATGRGGFVQSSTIVEDEQGYKSGYITVRVPSDKFDDTVKAIKDIAVRIDRESINGQDVTEQYTDLEARLRSAKAQEEQYLVILDKAETVQDILAVQSYLQSIRYEIESLQGQLDSLGNQTDYSTISVTLTEEVRVQVPAEKFDLVRDVKLAARYVVILFQAGLTLGVWLLIVGGAIVIPLGLFGVLAVWVIKKIVARF